MELITRFFAQILGPFLRPVSRWLLDEKRTWPTWYFETAVVVVLVFGVAACTTPHYTEVKEFLIVWLSAFAVVGTFLHAKVGYRMAEMLEEKEGGESSCYEYAGVYWFWKETLWFVVFVLAGAYPALVGVGVFILYPAWRKIHVGERKRLRT